jgi:hypothetical protein
MKVVFALLVVIILSLIGYSLYQLTSFEPKVPAPLVFDDAIDPTMMGNVQSAPNEIPLTPQQEDESQKAVDTIMNAVTELKNVEKNLSPSIKPTIEILSGAMATARFPSHLLSFTLDATQKRQVQNLKLDTDSLQSADVLATDSINCELNGGKISAALIGNDKNNTIACAANDSASPNDQIFIGGAGADTISDSFGNRIVNAGSGNDTIQLGSGRSILVLEEGWGQDKVAFNCAGSKIEPNQIPDDISIPWMHSYTNFIVVTPKLTMTDLEWDGMTLTRKGSNDRLTVNEKCFTLITFN